MSFKKIETSLGDKIVEMVNFQGKEIPKTVYKYRDWSNDYHKSILIRQEIFLPTAETFNDPFDCNIPFDISPYKENIELQLEFWTRYLMQQGIPKEEAIKNANKNIKNGEYTFEKIELKSLEQAKSIQSEIGVYSVTAIDDNPLMWAHYADDHKGFCVGFDSLKLFQFLISNNNDNIGGHINYCDVYPKIPINSHPQKILIGQLFSKAKYWDYEIEYRICKLFSPNALLTLPKEIIREVILGYRISKNDELNLKSVCKSNLSNAVIYETSPKKDSFEFEISELK